MKTTIIIYLIIGILLNFVGPLAKSYIKEFEEMKTSEILKRRVFKIMLRFFICVILFPFIYLLIAVDYFSRSKTIDKKIEKKPENNVNYNLLFFSQVPGAGEIFCRRCGFKQKIIGFIHGRSYDSNVWSTKTGFQCQQCGKFHKIICDNDNSEGIKCDCGGNLNREKPLFCPICKSKDIDYDMDFIT